MKRKFLITEIKPCPDCKPPNPCEKCGDPHGKGDILIETPLEDALKEFLVDVPNTGYFGIIIEKENSPRTE
jgi:hypothetical protein